mmetsp:Transcript_103093/g.291509  ORF Transcript_103093/g.291509 Transcript_103093/m.291509 type:complete len:228 (+) Transcript_103093:310-993(+)
MREHAQQGSVATVIVTGVAHLTEQPTGGLRQSRDGVPRDALIQRDIIGKSRIHELGLHSVMAENIHGKGLDDFVRCANESPNVHVVPNEALSMEAGPAEDPELTALQVHTGNLHQCTPPHVPRAGVVALVVVGKVRVYDAILLVAAVLRSFHKPTDTVRWADSVRVQHHRVKVTVLRIMPQRGNALDVLNTACLKLSNGGLQRIFVHGVVDNVASEAEASATLLPAG